MKNQNKIKLPLLIIFFSLLVGAVIILILGKNPLEFYQSLLQGAGLFPKNSYAANTSIFTEFMSFLNALTPMIFAALSFAVAMKGGLFNISISGQMLFAGFSATLLIGYSDLSSYIAKPLVVLVGILAGALFGGLIGFLKYKFNINEVVSSIMLNYITLYIISFVINVHHIDPVSRQSSAVSVESRLTIMDYEIGDLLVDVPFGIVLAIIAGFVIKFLFDKTIFGYEIKAVGYNKDAARYAGISVGRTIIFTMLISGALSGLAGVTYYLGYFESIQPKILIATGFDSIAVALLANNNPIGIFFSSFLITGISKGSIYMSSSTGLPIEIADVIIAIILLCSACRVYVEYRFKKKEGGKLNG